MTLMLTEREAASFGPRELKKPGTVPWAWQTISALKRQWELRELSVKEYDETLAELKEHKAWKLVPPASPPGAENVTAGRREQALRRAIQKLCSRLDKKEGVEFGTWNERCFDQFRMPRENMREEQLTALWKWLNEQARRADVKTSDIRSELDE
jgi:hypothetical protein